MIYNRDNLSTDDKGQEIWSESRQLFDLFVNDGDIHRYLGGCIPFHWHAELEIFVLLSGRVAFDTGQSHAELLPGEGCFINTCVLHSCTALCAEPCTYRSFVFDAGIIGGMPGSIFDTRYVRPLLDKGPSFLFLSPEQDAPYFQAFSRAFLANAKETSGYEFRVRSALSEILLYFHDTYGTVPHSLPAPSELRIKKMMDWIDQNLTSTVTVDQIAASAGISARECQRTFLRCLHYTPMEYLRRRRLLAASRLLIETDLPITEIALGCGFSSPSYFSYQFRLLAGNTPAEYRKKTREAASIS